MEEKEEKEGKEVNRKDPGEEKGVKEI